MAFFDDDPPTQQRRSAGPPRPPRPPRQTRSASEQDIRTRRLLALGGFILLLLAFAVLLKSCVDSSRRNALKDYNAEVNEIARTSGENVNEALRQLMTANDDSAVEQGSAIDTLAKDSAALTERARDLGAPGGLEAANQNLATALSLRAGALSRIADRLPIARGTARAAAATATEQIAGQMSALMASDVLWQLRVTPFIKDRFDEEDLGGDSIEPSVVLKDMSWLNAATVANRIGGESDTEDPAAEVAPGLHGHGIISVTANGTALNAGSQPTTVQRGSGLEFVVNVANQGENDESKVRVIVTGTKADGGSKVINESKTLPTTKQGTETPVRLVIASPPTGSVEITVEVKPVPGEKNTANNKSTYRVIFS